MSEGGNLWLVVAAQTAMLKGDDVWLAHGRLGGQAFFSHNSCPCANFHE